MSKPLTSRMGKKDKLVLDWTSEMSEAFNNIRRALTKDVELAYPEYGSNAERLELSADASGIGAGTCLEQVQGGIRKVISYASMTFSKAQKNYSALERELAALRWSVQHFRGFLFGVKFNLYSDHKPLLYLNNFSRQNARLMRTLNELEEFDYELRYRPGKSNT